MGGSTAAPATVDTMMPLKVTNQLGTKVSRFTPWNTFLQRNTRICTAWTQTAAISRIRMGPGIQSR